MYHCTGGRPTCSRRRNRAGSRCSTRSIRGANEVREKLELREYLAGICDYGISRVPVDTHARDCAERSGYLRAHFDEHAGCRGWVRNSLGCGGDADRAWLEYVGDRAGIGSYSRIERVCRFTGSFAGPYAREAGTPQGRFYLIGTAIMLVGIGLASRAGALRDKATTPVMDQSTKAKGSFVAGLVVAISAGLLSSALNFCYAFGAGALVQAREMGVSQVWISNVVAAPATTGGFVANSCYCVYLLQKNSSTFRFGLVQSRWNWLYGALMGAFWFGGLALYGVGVSRMGTFGTVVGWPLLMGTIIVTSNAAGIATGEWKGARGAVRGYLLGGMLIILVALWILSLAQRA